MTTPAFQSVGQLFLWRVAQSPDREAFRKPEGDGWRSYTWAQTLDEVRVVSAGLRALGVQNEDRVAILSGTRLEWVFADLGILCAAGATTTIYPSSKGDECAYILKDCGARFLIAENLDQAEKIRKIRGECPALEKVITMEGAGDGDFVITWADLAEKGKAWLAANAGEFEAVATSPGTASLATLIYTSGTTGNPKGVELTHDCWLYEGECIDAVKIISQEDVQYFWLPLAHSFGKVMEMAQLRIGFATAIDGRIEKIIDNLAAVQPTFMCAVPRIFEKVYNRVVGQAKEGGGLRYSIFNWALGVGKAASKVRQEGGEPGGLLGLQLAIANRLVFSKLQARFGGRMKFMISGSAPLSREMAEFFHAAGLLICEGYGLTETSAASFVNLPQKYRFGTVGFPLPGTELRIAPEDGEILIKGRGVMRGYHGMAEATAECLGADGWFKTGDIGEVDKDGFLRITDRKKDLIKTSGGKYVAPQALEGKMKALCPYVSQLVVHGDNRNFCSALVAVDPEAITKWANDNGLTGKSYAEITADAKTHTMIEGYIAQLNKELPSYSTIKRFAILPKDLSVEDGELTPSQKLKRKFVEKKYKAILDDFYTGAMEG